MRRHKNKITSIKDNSSNIFSSQCDIETCFTDFYKNLWSSTSTFSVNSLISAIPNDLPTLSEKDIEQLIRPVTKWEVFAALSSMPRGRSPGPDGLNVEFYLYYWNLIGDRFLMLSTIF